MANITIHTATKQTYDILLEVGKVLSGNNLYNIEDVYLHDNAPINFLDFKSDDGEIITYRRNYLPKSAIVDSSASLTLTPSQKYVLIRYYTENTGTEEEPIFDYKREIVGEYTGSEKLGKVTIKDLKENELYKLAVEDSDYSPAYEDVFIN